MSAKHRDNGCNSSMTMCWIDNGGNLCTPDGWVSRSDFNLPPIAVENGDCFGKWER